MKRLIVIFTLVALFAGGLYFIKTRMDSGAETVPQPALSVDFIECHISPTHYVVNESSAEQGSRVLVKYKSSPEESFNCAYEAGDGDFELVRATFLALTDSFVVVTEDVRAQQGSLAAYSLEGREALFTDEDVDFASIEKEGVQTDTIAYYAISDESPTVENCPDVVARTEEGIGSVILSRMSVNLTTGEAVDTGAKRCDASV